MNKQISNISREKEKLKKKLNKASTGMLILLYLVTLIVIIVWLFKLLISIKKEPSNRYIYIRKDPSYYYEEGEFCYDYYEKFLLKGVINTFDIPIKNIKKYTRALLGTIFISLISLIISITLIGIGKCSYGANDGFLGCGGFFYCIFVLAFILSAIFAIVLGHYYFKGDYNGFEEFSRCRYLTKSFKVNYNFIFKIKNGFNTPFVLILITELFNFIKLIAEGPD